MTQPDSLDRENNPENNPSVESEADETLFLPTNAVFDDADDDSPSAALTARQHQALEWLMSGGTITEAAELVGVKRQTVSRWVNHHLDFNRLYNQWLEMVRTGAEARMMGLADAAVDNLIVAVRESHDVKASQFLLKLLGIASRK